MTIISAKWRMYAQRKRYRNLRWAGELVCGVSNCQQTDARTPTPPPFPTFTPSHFPNPLYPLSHTHSTPFPTPTHSTLFPTPIPPLPSHFVCHSLEKTDCSALCPQIQGSSYHRQKVRFSPSFSRLILCTHTCTHEAIYWCTAHACTEEVVYI